MAMKKIEALEARLAGLETTVNHQKELLTLVNSTLLNQKIALEMIVSKLNSNEQELQVRQPSNVNVTTGNDQQSPESTKVFPMNRRVMV